ncbi:hypothetical protein JCM8547_007432 [Rhodosporidiobolus lusitaniae]
MACNIGAPWIQMLFVPMLWTICALFGSIAANMTTVIPRYEGAQIFQPFDLIDQGGSATRAVAPVAFFCSITANSISSANDLATLFPRWMFAVTVGVWAFCPWKVLASAGSFISFMSSYSIVLAPIADFLCADFFVVKKQKYNVPELNDLKGIYRYWHGFNLPALAALLISIPPNLPGMFMLLTRASTLGTPSTSTLSPTSSVWSSLLACTSLFPDRDSLIAETVLSNNVLAGRVPGYEEFALDGRAYTPSDERQLDELDGQRVVEV